jgi:hypothetical protein
MKNRRNKLILSIFTFYAFGIWPIQLTAQTMNSWDNLMSLRVGQKLEIVDQALQKHTVTLIAVNQDGLQVLSGKSQMNYERGEIRQVIRIDSRLKRRIIIGTAIGGGAGLASGAYVDSAIGNNETGHYSFGYTGYIGAAAAAVGAAIGAALGMVPKHTLLYQQ